MWICLCTQRVTAFNVWTSTCWSAGSGWIHNIGCGCAHPCAPAQLYGNLHRCSHEVQVWLWCLMWHQSPPIWSIIIKAIVNILGSTCTCQQTNTKVVCQFNTLEQLTALDCFSRVLAEGCNTFSSLKEPRRTCLMMMWTAFRWRWLTGRCVSYGDTLFIPIRPQRL